MESVHSSNVELVIKTVGSDSIVIQDAKEINEKGEELETTEYFLHVEGQTTEEENEDAQFVPVDDDCEESHEAQFVAMEVDDSDRIILHDKDVILWNRLCRICANDSDRLIPIFNGEGLEHNLCNKIHSYLPLTVSESDSLPIQVCYNCAATLLAWHEMSKGCLDAQQRLMDLQTKFNLKDQYYNDTAVEQENIQAILEVEASNSEESQAQSKCGNNVDAVQVTDVSDSDRTSTTSSKEETMEQTFTYMCGICDNLYNDEFDLIRHLNKDHEGLSNSLNPFRYECNTCGKSYLYKANLINHMRSHATQILGEDGIVEKSKIFVNQVLLFKCDICNHAMTHRRAFLRHIRVHADERPVICHECGKGFRIEDDLKRHIDDVHKKIKRFPCDICGNSFAAKATRDAHRRIHTGEKPFPCNVCNKTFRSVNLLGVHKRTHTDYRPHKCSYCDKAFRDRQKLAVHESIHTGIRPYACDVCGKLFAAKGEASRHRTVHFEDKPFLCSECGLNFRLNRYLRAHIKLHHKDKAEILLNDLDNN